jgi:hypothetical protein
VTRCAAYYNGVQQQGVLRLTGLSLRESLMGHRSPRGGRQGSTHARS